MESSADDGFFARAARVPPSVLVQHLPEGESVLLDLSSERYFGLDAVGARMWAAVTESDTLADAFQTLLDEYDATPEQLRADLRELVQSLADRGLVNLA